MLHLLPLSVCLVFFVAGDWGKENRFVMKAPSPNCPALLIWKPGDVKEVACVDQGCCRQEQYDAEVGGSAVCREHLSSVWHSGFGTDGFVQLLILTEAFAEERLLPRASWFLAVQHREHLVPLCRSASSSAQPLRSAGHCGKNRPDQE